jgi:hypothetical protein
MSDTTAVAEPETTSSAEGAASAEAAASAAAEGANGSVPSESAVPSGPSAPSMPSTPPAAEIRPEAFDAVAAAFRSGGVAAATARLNDILLDCRQYARLFDALCLAKRLEMGLPAYAPNLSEVIPPDLRKPYEDYVVGTCRKVRDLYLEAGRIEMAWPYARTLGETEPVTAALESARLPADNEPSPGAGDGAATGADIAQALIDIAWNQGANPRRGYEWILERHGTCSAISALEQSGHLKPADREACVALLVRRLHRDLTAALRMEVQQREGAAPPEPDVNTLLMGRPWLFENNAYHIDASHLSAGVRMALILPPGPDMALAVQLCEYGENLQEHWQYSGDPPFRNIYKDGGTYLRALQSPVGFEADQAVEHFRSKITADDPAANPTFCAQVYVNLLVRLGRPAQALAAFEMFKADADGPPTGCPSYIELCRLAGRPDKWAEYARRHNDLVSYAAALTLQGTTAS